MLSLNSLLEQSFCSQDFWQLPVTKEFDQPEYYIGQTVFHLMKVEQGEILHPVTVHGVAWTGVDWEYLVELPPSHPRFKKEDREWDWLGDYELEAM